MWTLSNLLAISADTTWWQLPTLQVLDPATVKNLEKFVGNGGILILTARSGFKNQDNLATEVPPGLLERMAKGDLTAGEGFGENG